MKRFEKLLILICAAVITLSVIITLNAVVNWTSGLQPGTGNPWWLEEDGDLKTGTGASDANFILGNGTPNVTQNGEDAYIEGTLEVDGAVRFDGAVTANGGFTATIARAVPLQLTAFTIYTADYPVPITHTTTPGLDLNNESASIVWNTTETSKAFVTLRVPNDFSSGGAFRVLMDRSDNSTQPQVDFEAFVSNNDAAWDASVTNYTPVSITTIAGTPQWVTLSATTDFTSLAGGEAVVFRIWNSGNTTGNNLEMYYAEFYYTAVQ